MKITKNILNWLKEITGDDIHFYFIYKDSQEEFKGYSFNNYIKVKYADELKKFTNEVLK